MAIKRTSRRTPRAKKLNITDATFGQNSTAAWLLIQSLTCKLIAKLDTALRECEDAENGWERLFGAKDSTVVNVQKLVAVLAEISDRLVVSAGAAEATHDAAGMMRPEDMEMLKRWLEAELTRANTP